MAPPRKSTRITPTLDIPVLTDVVEAAEPIAAKPPAAEAVSAPTGPVSQEVLMEVLTERIAAVTDRLLRDASAEIHATLVEKVWERLREEIPAIVEAALRENSQD